MSLTFEPFANAVEYINVNSQIVSRWFETMKQKGERQFERLLDLASGAGTMVQLMLDSLPKDWHKPLIICVDRSFEALEITRQRLIPKLTEKIECLCTDVEKLNVSKQSTDVVTFGNGIHYLDPEKQNQVMDRVRDSLKPGGWFFFNTAFYREARPEWTLPFYQKKVRLAVQKLREKSVTRQKEERRPTSADFLPRDHYEKLVTNNGFELSDVVEVEARLGQKAWEMISGYSQYAAGALHGFPTEEAAAALQEAIAPAIEEFGRTDENSNRYISRNWLAVAARAV